ncbi:MAG: IPT/TIG domain-containing protein [Spirochaetaceae bacterium]|jgi:transglutaminase-like putative cysteine protease|nr:IPT/TIG domain-containing protein [Spirochaetaceae bacterium]
MSKRKAVFFLIYPIFLAACAAEKPVIESLDTQTDSSGTGFIVIKGLGFGNERGESFVNADGVFPTASSYKSWSDNEIIVRIPEFCESGLIYVHKNGKKSNPMIFVTAHSLPRLSRLARTDRPVIDSVSPKEAFTGAVVTITGSGFGETRRQKNSLYGEARFTRPQISGAEPDGLFITPNENAGGYLSWREREIKIRIPDGAGSGFISVFGEGGESARIPFSAQRRGGEKNMRGKGAFIISYSTDIVIEDAPGDFIIYLWAPRPVFSASQRVKEILSRTVEPFLENYHGKDLYKFSGLKIGDKKTITTEMIVETWAVETRVESALVNTESPPDFEKFFLEESRLVPCGDDEIKSAAKKIVLNEHNPYRKARLIYDELLTYDIGVEHKNGGALDALRSKKADAYSISLLFCALSRAAGVCAAPVSGVVVDAQNNAYNHYWAQFYLKDFGWVPLDVSFGAGSAPYPYTFTNERKNYYFGNIDNQRVAFSEGEAELSKMDVRGRLTSFERVYSLQNIFEEAAGELNAYSSHWGEVIVGGSYYNN